MSGIFNFLKKYIDRNSNRKSYILTNGNIIGCPQETLFFNKKVIPMNISDEKRNDINKMALESAIRKDLIAIAKENKTYQETEKGTNYFIKGDEKENVRVIVKVVGSSEAIKAKEYVLRNLMEILEASEKIIEFNIFSFYNQSKKTIKIVKNQKSIIIQEERNKTELEIDSFMNMEETEKLNKELFKLSEKELRLLSLRTLIKHCDKCLYNKNCKIKDCSQD